jgi:hypothetical protein
VSSIWNTIGVFALGGVGWLVVHFVGQPLRQFYNLRGEVIHRSVLYANVIAVQKEFPDGSVEQVDQPEDEIKRLREAEDAFRDLAAHMRAFALNERFAAWFVKQLGYDPMEASTLLLGVSNTLHTYGSRRANAGKALEQALRFRTIA